MTITISFQVTTREDAERLVGLAFGEQKSSPLPPVPTVDASSESNNEPPISDAVKALAEQNGIDWTTIQGSGKNGRVTKKDVTTAIDARTPTAPAQNAGTTTAPNPTTATDTGDSDDPFADNEPAAAEEDPFAIDESEPEEFTKEDVRAALMEFQSKYRDKLLANGRDADSAKKDAQGHAVRLLKDVSGAENLGSLAESKYGAVVKRARELAAKL